MGHQRDLILDGEHRAAFTLAGSTKPPFLQGGPATGHSGESITNQLGLNLMVEAAPQVYVVSLKITYLLMLVASPLLFQIFSIFGT